MKIACLLLLLIVCAHSYNEKNLYQACTNGGSSYYYTNPFYSYYYDYGTLTLPYDQYYTYYDPSSGDTVYFNVCAGTSVCGGAMACVKDRFGLMKTSTYPFYAATSIGGGAIEWYTPDTNLYLYINCDTNAPAPEVYSFYINNYGDLSIYLNSLFGCTLSSTYESYVTPVDYSSFSAPIYLTGRIPYFLQDFLGDYFESEFVGMIYYSNAYGLTINGTLSYENSSHFVSFIYEKEVPLNPPRAVSYIQTSSTSPMVCRIQGTNDQSDSEFANDIFGMYSNAWMSLQRNYTSIYFDPGSTFLVNMYTPNRFEYQATLLTRVTDGKVVFIGNELISPWLTYAGVGQFISEVDWNNISSTPLGKESFIPPSSWDCGF